MSDSLTVTFEGRPVYLDEVLPIPGPWATIAAVRDANRCLGHHWFTRDAMDFFQTSITRDPTGSVLLFRRFFITAERMEEDDPVRYTIRAATNRGQVVTIGHFRGYVTYAEACAGLDALVQHLAEEGCL